MPTARTTAVLVLVLWLLGVPGMAGDAAAPAAGATGAAEAKPLKPTSHKPWSDGLRTFCQERHLAIQQQDEGPIRLMRVGNVQVPKADEIIRLAKQTLDGYEIWTGRQGLFMATPQPEEEIYHLVVMNDGDCDALQDWFVAKGLRGKPEGDRLKTMGFPSLRMMFAKASGVNRLPEQWGIYSASCLAIDAFYHARTDKRPPAWIREGMAAEMQRLQTKQVRCTTIAYEERSDQAINEDWPKEVARLITTRAVSLISATEVMRLDINGLSGAHYRQIWSLCTFLRARCGNARGPRNPFYRILIATADGQDSGMVVKQVLGLSDPGLTPAWRQWALEFH